MLPGAGVAGVVDAMLNRARGRTWNAGRCTGVGVIIALGAGEEKACESELGDRRGGRAVLSPSDENVGSLEGVAVGDRSRGAEGCSCCSDSGPSSSRMAGEAGNGIVDGLWKPKARASRPKPKAGDAVADRGKGTAASSYCSSESVWRERPLLGVANDSVAEVFGEGVVRVKEGVRIFMRTAGRGVPMYGLRRIEMFEDLRTWPKGESCIDVSAVRLSISEEAAIID
jgi:hypothetical protein